MFCFISFSVSVNKVHQETKEKEIQTKTEIKPSMSTKEVQTEPYDSTATDDDDAELATITDVITSFDYGDSMDFDDNCLAVEADSPVDELFSQLNWDELSKLVEDELDPSYKL